MAINEKYSYRDYTGRSLIDVEVSGLNDSVIRGSCFYQEAELTDTERSDIEKHIFPEDMVGVTFERCNLDNVHIPPGNTVGSNCSHRLVRIQNDLEDWILDEASLLPKEPLDKKRFQNLGISINPSDIPLTLRFEESVTQEKERQSRQGVQQL